MNTKIIGKFQPNRKAKFTDGDGKAIDIPAMSIKDAGEAIVITGHETRGAGIRYSLTHAPTGASMTANRTFANINALGRVAKAFWALLDSKEQKVWESSDNPAKVKKATNKTAFKSLVEGLEKLN